MCQHGGLGSWWGSYRFQVAVDNARPAEKLERLHQRDGMAPHLRGAQPSEVSLLHHLIQVLSGKITYSLSFVLGLSLFPAFVKNNYLKQHLHCYWHWYYQLQTSCLLFLHEWAGYEAFVFQTHPMRSKEMHRWSRNWKYSFMWTTLATRSLSFFWSSSRISTSAIASSAYLKIGWFEGHA